MMLQSASSHFGPSSGSSSISSSPSWLGEASVNSLRQTLAKTTGRTHFQVAPSGVVTPSRQNQPFAVRYQPSQPPPERRRGRSRAPKLLWAYMDTDRAREFRASPTAAMPTKTTQTVVKQPITAIDNYEAPPAETSLIPILSRPPDELEHPSRLEKLAWRAEIDEDVDGASGTADQLGYLHPPAPKSHETFQPSNVLYTRAQLPEIDLATRHLWHALHHFAVRVNDYASSYGKDKDALKVQSIAPHPVAAEADRSNCPFASSALANRLIANEVSRIFNWSSLRLPIAIEGEWYGVLFRSLRRPSSESIDLYEADRLSHEEAVDSGGLILYWYGVPNHLTGENLATCLWTNRSEAIQASQLPMHKKAVKHAKLAYDKFDLGRYKVVKKRGEQGVRIEVWNDEVDM